MKRLIPFSYELGHLFLHLFPLQLFLQQNLEPRDAAIALSILLVGLRDKTQNAHEERAEQTLSCKQNNVTPPTMFFLSVMKKIGNHTVRLQYFYVNKFCWLWCPLPTATPCSQCAIATVRTATARRPNTPARLQATLQGWKRPNRAAEDSWLTALQSVPRIVSSHCAV